MSNYYVIPDIHGQAHKLTPLLIRILEDMNSDDTILFLGDYIDRGKESKEVIEMINNLKEQHHIITLLGNHDLLFYNAIMDLITSHNEQVLLDTVHLLRKNSLETLQSFDLPVELITTIHDLQLDAFTKVNGKSLVDLLKSKVNDWMNTKSFKEFQQFILQSEYYHETKDYIFSHSGGVHFLKPDEQSISQWLFSRDFKQRRFCTKTFVVGHTPIDGLEPTLKGQLLFCDTGSVFDKDKPLPFIKIEGVL